MIVDRAMAATAVIITGVVFAAAFTLVGIVLGVAELVTRLIHRRDPPRPDDDLWLS